MLPVDAQQERIGSVRQMLLKAKPDIKMALPRHITPDQLIRVSLTSIRRTPKLLECDQISLCSAIMQAAQLGLVPDDTLGAAYLVPFRKQVQLVIGYKGLLDLARRSGTVTTIYAQAVHEKDEFSYQYGLHPDLVHKPFMEGDRGEVTCAYAVAAMKDGGYQFEVMSLSEIIDIRNKSQGYQAAVRYNRSHPWMTHFEQMAKKTVLRRLCKYLPMSTEAMAAIYIDQSADRGEIPVTQEVLGEQLEPAVDINDELGINSKPAPAEMPVGEPQHSHAGNGVNAGLKKDHAPGLEIDI